MASGFRRFSVGCRRPPPKRLKIVCNIVFLENKNYKVTEVKYMTNVIRVKRDTYERLALLAGELQMRMKRFVSVDDAVRFLIAKNDKRLPAYWKDLRHRRL